MEKQIPRFARDDKRESPLRFARDDSLEVTMDRERPIERFLPLRPVEFDILLSLAAGERHGYGIIQDAEARKLGVVPDVGTLYRAIRRLQDQRMVEAATRRAAPDSDDERRNYYRITPLGRRVAQAEARRLVALT